MAVDRWNTHRGDEWWFSAGVVAAEGSYNAAVPMFEISRVTRGADRPDAMLYLLQRTVAEFPGTKVLVALDQSTRPALQALAESAQITWQEFKQPFSLWANILIVVPPNNSSKPTPLRGAA
ncbi:MAG TPA: hypothetical protein VM576_00005 [Xanthomonadaceae bacterium]|nr:hypothetical protein [Xanthomonadaceae bacterium]